MTIQRYRVGDGLVTFWPDEIDGMASDWAEYSLLELKALLEIAAAVARADTPAASQQIGPLPPAFFEDGHPQIAGKALHTPLTCNTDRVLRK